MNGLSWSPYKNSAGQVICQERVARSGEITTPASEIQPANVFDYLSEIIVVLWVGRPVTVIVIWHRDRISDSDQLLVGELQLAQYLVGVLREQRAAAQGGRGLVELDGVGNQFAADAFGVVE